MVAAFGIGRQQPCNMGRFVTDPFPWLLGCHFAPVSHDFFDLVGILGLGFFFMAAWELNHRSWVRAALVVVACAGIGEAWRVSLTGAGLFCPVPRGAINGGLTGTDRVLLALGLAFLGVVLAAALPSVSSVHVEGKRLGAAWRRARWRWAAGLVAFWGVLAVALQHPYYQEVGFTNWRILCALLFSIYLVGGLPYAVISCYQRTGMADDVRDPGFMLLLAFRGLGRAMVRPRTWTRARRTLWNRRSCLVARDLLVKAFFVPVMTSFFFGNCADLFRTVPTSQLPGAFGDAPASATSFSPRSWYSLVLNSFMVMDVSLGLIGYLCASRWLGNKSVGVEPTGLGWAVALACYPPFNGVSGQLLPYHTAPAGARPYLDVLGTGSASLLVSDILSLVALAGYAVYVFATMAFGLRFSNLTHRGVIERGALRVGEAPGVCGQERGVVGREHPLLCLAVAVSLPRSLERRVLLAGDHRGAPPVAGSTLPRVLREGPLPLRPGPVLTAPTRPGKRAGARKRAGPSRQAGPPHWWTACYIIGTSTPLRRATSTASG